MNVLILDRFDSDALLQLRQNSQLQISQIASGPVNTKAMQEAEILVIRSKTKVNQEFLQTCPKLKYIITTTSGL